MSNEKQDSPRNESRCSSRKKKPVHSRNQLLALAKIPLLPQPQKPAASPSQSGEKASQVAVNIEELTAQIAGNNLALRTIEAELDEKLSWNADRLEAMVRRLDALLVKSQDLAMFRGLISASEQAMVGQIIEPRHVFSQVADRIVEARARVQGGDFTGAEAERESELRRLDDLSTRLGNLAAEE